MSKVQQFAQLLDQYIADGVKERSPRKCRLARLYLSMSDKEKSQLKTTVGAKWKYVSWIIHWWDQRGGREYCASLQPEQGSGSPEGSPSSVPWPWIIGGVVLLLLILAVVFFLMRR